MKSKKIGLEFTENIIGEATFG